MGFLEWVSHNWISLLQSAGIIGSLLFTGLTLRLDAKERRDSHVLSVTLAHRELWTNLYKRPELSRVLDPNADLTNRPVTHEEEMFVLLLIVHLNTAQEVLKSRKFAIEDGALRRDIRWFLSLPIPEVVWEKTKGRQDSAFVSFVESCRASSNERPPFTS